MENRDDQPGDKKGVSGPLMVKLAGSLDWDIVFQAENDIGLNNLYHVRAHEIMDGYVLILRPLEKTKCNLG